VTRYLIEASIAVGVLILAMTASYIGVMR